jgi:hypothetical protein
VQPSLDYSKDKRGVTRDMQWYDPQHPLLTPDEDGTSSLIPWGFHSKIIAREYPRGFCMTVGCTKRHGWMYVGSHNTSAASWGAEERGRLVIRNFELGVVTISTPSMSPGEGCGPDLDILAPLPFDPKTLMQHHPAPL